MNSYVHKLEILRLRYTTKKINNLMNEMIKADYFCHFLILFDINFEKSFSLVTFLIHHNFSLFRSDNVISFQSLI